MINNENVVGFINIYNNKRTSFKLLRITFLNFELQQNN